MSDESFCRTLSIFTPSEIRDSLKNSSNSDKEHCVEKFDEFVEDFKVEYFFSADFRWNLDKIAGVLPGLNKLLKRYTAFVDCNGETGLLLQPSENPADFFKNNDVEEYAAWWDVGYYGPNVYSVVISGSFLSYVNGRVNKLRKCGGWNNRTVSPKEEDIVTLEAMSEE